MLIAHRLITRQQCSTGAKYDILNCLVTFMTLGPIDVQNLVVINAMKVSIFGRFGFKIKFML